MAIASSHVLWTVFQVLTKGCIVCPKRTQSPDHVEGVTSDLVYASSVDRFPRSIIAESRSQKGENPLFQFTCQ
jgi:hypothetical protein